MVGPLADDANVQFTTGLVAAVVEPRPVVADLVTWGLLGGRRTLVDTPARFLRRFLGRFLMAWRTIGRKKVSRNEKGLFEAVEGVAPLHETQFQCMENFVMERADR